MDGINFNWTTIAWIGGLIFVYLFGIYEGRAQGRKRRISEETQEKHELVPHPPEIIKIDDPGLIRIKNDEGRLVLDLDGQRANTSELTESQRKRLIDIVNIIRPWVEEITASPPVKSNPTLPSPNPGAPPAVFAPAQPPPPPDVIRSTKPSTKPVEKENDIKAPPTSIVGQINLILQARIKNTPLASRSVVMMESPSGGVNVFIGVQRYEGIDDIPDEEVKTAIRAAISEWENRYTPGLK